MRREPAGARSHSIFVPTSRGAGYNGRESTPAVCGGARRIGGADPRPRGLAASLPRTTEKKMWNIFTGSIGQTHRAARPWAIAGSTATSMPGSLTLGTGRRTRKETWPKKTTRATKRRWRQFARRMSATSARSIREMLNTALEIGRRVVSSVLAACNGTAHVSRPPTPRRSPCLDAQLAVRMSVDSKLGELLHPIVVFKHADIRLCAMTIPYHEAVRSKLPRHDLVLPTAQFYRQARVDGQSVDPLVPLRIVARLYNNALAEQRVRSRSRREVVVRSDAAICIIFRPATRVHALRRAAHLQGVRNSVLVQTSMIPNQKPRENAPPSAGLRSDVFR